MKSTWLALAMMMGVGVGCGAKTVPEQKSVVVNGALPPVAEIPATNEVDRATTTRVRFVVKAPDRRHAVCMMDQAFDGLQCAFGSTALRSGVAPHETLLQPLRSINGHTLLVGGVWQAPEVQQRSSKNDDPFEVTCSLNVLGKAGQTRVRVGKWDDWAEFEELPVGRVADCQITRSFVNVAAPNKPLASQRAASGRVHFPRASHVPVLGPMHAKVTMVVFSDYQCPHCATLNPTLRLVANANPNTVAVHLRHFPLPSHTRAMPAAVAVQAAQRQGMGWALSDMLFQNQKALTDVHILNYAASLGLKMADFKTHLLDPAVVEEVKLDRDLALNTGVVRGTPTVIVNGLKYTSARTEAAFQAVIDDEVKRADAHLAAGVPLADLYERLCK